MELLPGVVMVRHPGSVCRQELVPPPCEVAQWQPEIVQSVADIARVLETITSAAMASAGFSEKESLRLRLALEEALVNAHKHGHQGDWTKPITLHYHVTDNGVVARIEDQGGGFDPTEVPDPSAPENMERPSGRGLFLMRAYMTRVCHNERGNCICLCKHCPETTRPQP
jgi:serine/threonine-protein kinase RsbW